MTKETLKELRRVLSKLGVASRRQSEGIIKSGRVSVDGQIITNPKEPVYMSQDIKLDGQEIKDKKTIYYAFNKPKGVITTMKDEFGRKCIADYMPQDQYLFPVGRLDKNTRGLIIFTNDNQFANELMTPKHKVEKAYRVKVQGDFIRDHLSEMKRGIFVDEERLTAEKVRISKVNKKTTWIDVTLTEGKNRQIRRMLEALNYEILELIRTRIGKLRLGKLGIKPGQYIVIKKDWVI